MSQKCPKFDVLFGFFILNEPHNTVITFKSQTRRKWRWKVNIDFSRVDFIYQVLVAGFFKSNEVE